MSEIAIVNQLSGFLPTPLAARLLRAPHVPLIGHSERFEAVVVFADISGFTPLTEMLGQIGPEGAEELSRVLRDYFTPLIEQAHHWGGVVGKFAGDAMTLLFAGEEAIPRALAGAQAIQRQAQRAACVQTRAGEFTLGMKLGLSVGPVLMMVAGTQERADYLFAGPPLDMAAAAEHRADPGEIVLHPDLLGRLSPAGFVLEPLAEGYARLLEVQRPIAPAPLPPLPTPADEEQAIRALHSFIPPPVYELLLAGQTPFIYEHRRVTILFIRFDGLDYVAPQVVDRVKQYVARLVETASRFGGYLSSVYTGDKGSHAVILFGAPTAHENDEERALLCALALHSLPSELDFITAQCIGITSGRVFIGTIGSLLRREYTVQGTAINLAARLMQAAAPGQILVDRFTQQMAADAFDWQPLPPLQVKGQTSPVTVFALQGQARVRPLRLQEPHYTLPMVGRQAELAYIADLLTQVKATGRGQIVSLVAEAGMGKSRLAAEVIGRALALGFVGYGGEGLSHGVTTPYLAWRPVLRGLLAVNELQSHAGQVEAARQTLAAISPDLLLRLPLLGDLLGLEIADNEITLHFSPHVRRQSLFALVADLIRHRAAEAPCLLVLEDAHWLDDLSREMLAYLARQVVEMPVLLLIVHRPPEIGGRSPLPDGPWPALTEIRLGPFSPQESGELIRLKLGGRTVPPALLARIEERAQGNPFFVDEFVNLVQAQGVDLDDEQALADLQVPTSLHALVVSRLDQLAESERLTIRVASVIGRLFRARWLLAIYPGSMRQEIIHRDLERLSALELTPLERAEPELEYLFKHAITQEVAYGTLSFAVRRMLHRRVAAYLEESYADNLEAWYAILAYHYRQAEEWAQELAYTRLAARQAEGHSSLRQAADFYDRAVELLETHRLGVAEERFDLRYARFKLYAIAGRTDRVPDEAEALATLSADLDPGRRVQALLAQGRVAQIQADLERSATCYDQAVALARRHGDRAGLIEALRARGAIYFDRGQYEAGKKVLAQVIAQADAETELWRAAASARQILAWITYDEARYGEAEALWLQALALFRSHGDRPGEALVLSNLGALYATIGQVDKGISFVEQGLALATQIGYKVGEEEAERLLGDLLTEAGLFEAGRTHFERAIALGWQQGNAYTVGYSRVRLTDILLETGGSVVEAESLCRQALDLLLPGQGREWLGYPWHMLGRVLMLQGRWDEARAALEESLHLRREIGQTATITCTLADLGQLHLACGDLEAARSCAEEMWGYLFPDEGEGIESATACLSCYRIFQALGEPERSARALRRGYDDLQKRAAGIGTEERRRAFLEGFAAHRQLREAYARA